MTTRRNLLLEAAGLTVAGTAFDAAAQRAPAAEDAGYSYDYLLVEVPRRSGRVGGPAPFLAHLKAVGVPAVVAAGGEVPGYFTPLIGWTSEQLAVMVRWSGQAPAVRDRALAPIVSHPSAGKVERSRLAPTLRPGPHDRPRTTGIYTHRRFEIRTRDLAEFVDLSGRAWLDFEREFDAAIFGLFKARARAAETRDGVTRMLLNTQYASHAVWEASRTPAAKAAGLFQRRSDLTLTTRVASLHFTPVGV